MVPCSHALSCPRFALIILNITRICIKIPSSPIRPLGDHHRLLSVSAQVPPLPADPLQNRSFAVSHAELGKKRRHPQNAGVRVSGEGIGEDLKHAGSADSPVSDYALGGKRERQYDQHIRGKNERMDEALCVYMADALGVDMPLSAERYLSLLKSCIHGSSSFCAKQISAHIARHGVELQGLLGDYLVVSLAKCGAMEDAIEVSNKLPRRSVFSWTAMISSYAKHGHGDEALRLYQRMREDGIEPNHFTFVSLFQACGSIGDLNRAKKLRDDASREGFLTNPFVGNSLVSMYTKCGAVEEAEDAFFGLSSRNVVAWNTMLSAYVRRGRAEQTLSLYRQMQEEGVESPDHLSIMICLQACGILADREKGRSARYYLASLAVGQTLHADACKMSYVENAFVATALVTMYAKCRAVPEAEVVFGSVYDRDLATWNAMLTAYIEQGYGERSLELYSEMQKLGVSMDEITFTCCMQGCGETGCLDVCKQLHFSIVCAGYDSVDTIAASLINTYGYCGSMHDGEAFFDALSEPDHVTWTASISGLAWHGSSLSSLRMFEKLNLAGFEADEILLTTVLTACSHAGLVSEGLGSFASLCCACRISPNLKHYGILLDLLGRAGDFKRAENALETMPIKPDASIWLSLLGICQTHGYVEFARRAFVHVIRLRPSETYAYVLMSNIFEADAQRLHKQDNGCGA